MFMRSARLKRSVPGRMKLLATMARRHGWTRGVELGVFKGRLFFYLLDACPALSMIGVDTWAPGEQDTPPRIKKTAADSGARSYEQFPLGQYAHDVAVRAATYGDRATILRMTTLRAAAHVEPRSVDFVFVDACHEEDPVRQDIAAWQSKIREGGWLLGHDSDIPAVHRAIEDMAPGWRGYPDSVWGLPVAEVPAP